MLRRLAPVLTALLATLVATPLAAQTGTHDGAAWTTAARMHRGVNIIGYDPIWNDPAKARFKARYFPMIRHAGFDFVRVVLQSFGHMDSANRLDPQWLKTLDWVVRNATDAGLSVIVDEHDFDVCSKDADACRPKLLAFWRQVGERYRSAPPSVLFELLNEPHGQLDAARWNATLAELIPLVRASNPDRTLVIGPTSWNSFKQLPTLALPANDRNILVTFHYYDPFHFTHQGAGWAEGVKDLHGVPFTDADAAQIGRDFDTVAAWSRTNDRPVLLGEFGAYDGSGTPIADRARWTATVRADAEARGFPWAYWQFDSNFIVYDVDGERWVEPILQALIPGTPS